MGVSQSTIGCNEIKNIPTVEDEDCSKTSLMCKNITVLGSRTSVRIEPEMWNALKDIARRERCSIHDICSLIQIRKNTVTSLTAAIRVFIMLYYRAASTSEGHAKAGHGDFENMKQRARITVDMKSLKQQPINANETSSDGAESDYKWVY